MNNRIRIVYLLKKKKTKKKETKERKEELDYFHKIR